MLMTYSFKLMKEISVLLLCGPMFTFDKWNSIFKTIFGYFVLITYQSGTLSKRNVFFYSHSEPKINTHQEPNASKNQCWWVEETVSIASNIFMNPNNTMLLEHEREWRSGQSMGQSSRKFKPWQLYSRELDSLLITCCLGSFPCANIQR